MARPSKPWSAEERARRDRILATARSLGLTRRTLGEAAGLRGTAGDVRMTRWAKGEAHLSDEQMSAMESRLAGMPEAVDPGDATPGARLTGASLESALSELDRLVGDAGDQDAKDQLRALAVAHRREAVGTLLQLMVGARSENVRLRAAEVLLERSDGKAIQAIVDLTPKPPARDEDLLAKLLALASGSYPGPGGSDGGNSAPPAGEPG